MCVCVCVIDGQVITMHTYWEGVCARETEKAREKVRARAVERERERES